MRDQKGNTKPDVTNIPPEKIKEALILSGLGNPVENICNISNAVFAQIGAINNQSLVDIDWVNSFMELQRLFNFNVALLRELE